MKPISRRYLPLLVLALAHGKPVLRTRLQKIVFRLSKTLFSGSVEPSEYNFIPFHYGPYSKEVYTDLVTLDRESYVEFGPNSEDGYPESYSATDAGIAIAKELFDSLPDGFRETARYEIDRGLQADLNKLLNEIYTEYPDYAVRSRLPRSNSGRIVPAYVAPQHRPSATLQPVVETSTLHTGTTSAHNWLRFIRAVTGFSDSQLAQLLGVSVDQVKEWLNGKAVPNEYVPHVEAVHDIVERAQKRHPTERALQRWLYTPGGSSRMTPAQAIAAGDYGTARFLIFASPSRAATLPSWVYDQIPDKYQDSLERLPEAVPQDEDSQLFALYGEPGGNSGDEY
jgi:uncharacterized protein